MKLLFINLSDPGVLGAKSGKALEKKHKPSFWSKDKSKITVLNLMDCAVQFANSGIIALDQERLKTLQDWLSGRKQNYKIIIAAHGKVDDTDYCYAESDSTELFKTHKLLNYAQLAVFIKTLFAVKEQKIPFNITLSICYSARSEDHEKDHILQLAEINIQTSFAAKFYALLLADYNLRLKAVTGSVQFDEKTGSLLVESEEVIQVIERYDQALKEMKCFEQEQVQPILKEFIEKNSYEVWQIYLRDNCYKKNETPLDKIWLEFLALQEKYEQLRLIKNQGSQKHYGQVVFDYNPVADMITISLKHQKKQTVLKTVKRDDFIAHYNHTDGPEKHPAEPSEQDTINKDPSEATNIINSNHKA